MRADSNTNGTKSKQGTEATRMKEKRAAIAKEQEETMAKHLEFPRGKKAAGHGAEDIKVREKKINGLVASAIQTDAKGPKASQHNIKAALLRLGVTLSYDEFQDRSIITGLTGFDQLDDAALIRLWLLIEEKFKFRATKDYFWTVIADAARQNSFHPVRDYLNSLKWDGKPRIDTWLTVYAQAKDTPYTRAVGALMLVAGVRRIRQPGCKFDEMLVFESQKQGLDKSAALAILAVNPDWFTDDLPLSADTKIVMERMKGRWIVEAAELKGMRGATNQHLKALLSRQVDRARMSYDRVISELKRQNIMFGSTNDAQFLYDQTGNRRYWPIKIGVFDLVKLKQDRDQLWAEAAAREAQGVSIRLDRSLWEEAAKEQEERTVAEPWIELINNVFGDMKGKLPTMEVWRIVDVSRALRTQSHNERLGTAMRACGWERKQTHIGGKMVWCYVRGQQPYKMLTLSDDATSVSAKAEPKPSLRIV
jgi:predicted P-loop ATPase